MADIKFPWPSEPPAPLGTRLSCVDYINGVRPCAEKMAKEINAWRKANGMDCE